MKIEPMWLKKNRNFVRGCQCDWLSWSSRTVAESLIIYSWTVKSALSWGGFVLQNSVFSQFFFSQIFELNSVERENGHWPTTCIETWRFKSHRLNQLIIKPDTVYRRSEEYFQSFNFRHHFMLSKERQVPTVLLPGEVSIVSIALCRLCGVWYRLHTVGKS